MIFILIWNEIKNYENLFFLKKKKIKMTIPEQSQYQLFQECIEKNTNIYTLSCPRCTSIILKQNVASLSNQSEFNNLANLPPLVKNQSQTSEHYWIIKDMMSFENIGFSFPENEKHLRYLVCAECETGPLGYRREGEEKCIIAADRVRYNK